MEEATAPETRNELALYYWYGRLADIFINFDPIPDEILADLSYLEDDEHMSKTRP
jgi:hypothetical protein